MAFRDEKAIEVASAAKGTFTRKLGIGERFGPGCEVFPTRWVSILERTRGFAISVKYCLREQDGD